MRSCGSDFFFTELARCWFAVQLGFESLRAPAAGSGGQGGDCSVGVRPTSQWRSPYWAACGSRTLPLPFENGVWDAGDGAPKFVISGG